MSTATVNQIDELTAESKAALQQATNQPDIDRLNKVIFDLQIMKYEESQKPAPMPVVTTVTVVEPQPVQSVQPQPQPLTNLSPRRTPPLSRMSNNKLPWFKFYCTNFLANTIGLTNEEVGVYAKLLAYGWVNGPLPNDLGVISSIVGEGGKVERVLARYFQPDQHGNLCVPWLEELRDEAAAEVTKNAQRTKKATAARRTNKGGKS